MIGPQNWMVVHKFTVFFFTMWDGSRTVFIETRHVSLSTVLPTVYLSGQNWRNECFESQGFKMQITHIQTCNQRGIHHSRIFFYSSVIPEYSRPIPIFTHLCFRVSWCIPKVSGPAKVPNPWVSLLSFPFQMATMVHYPISSRKTLWLWPFNPPFKWVKQKEAGVHGNHPRIG